jgi:hypothetical protein
MTKNKPIGWEKRFKEFWNEKTPCDYMCFRTFISQEFLKLLERVEKEVVGSDEIAILQSSMNKGKMTREEAIVVSLRNELRSGQRQKLNKLKEEYDKK